MEFPSTNHQPPTFKGIALSIARLYLVEVRRDAWLVPATTIAGRANLLLPFLTNPETDQIAPQIWTILAALVYMYYWSRRTREESDAVSQCLQQSRIVTQNLDIAQQANPENLIDWIEMSYERSEAWYLRTHGRLHEISDDTSFEESEASTEMEDLGDYIRQLRQAAAAMSSSSEESLVIEQGTLAEVTKRIRKRLRKLLAEGEESSAQESITAQDSSAAQESSTAQESSAAQESDAPQESVAPRPRMLRLEELMHPTDE